MAARYLRGKLEYPNARCAVSGAGFFERAIMMKLLSDLGSSSRVGKKKGAVLCNVEREEQ